MSNCEDEDLEIPEFDGDDIKITHQKNGEWIDNSSKPMKRIRCLIDDTLVSHVRDIEHNVVSKLGGDNEFGGYVKWHWQNGDIKVDDIIIPEQEVTAVTVDFKGARNPNYTGVFHRHPDGCMAFSGTDDQYINSNNEISILFVRGTFHTGIVNIKLPDGSRFQTVLDICIISHHQYENIDVSMVNKKQTFFRGSPGFGCSGNQGNNSPKQTRTGLAPFTGTNRSDSIGFNFDQDDLPGFGALFGEDDDDDGIEIIP